MGRNKSYAGPELEHDAVAEQAMTKQQVSAIQKQAHQTVLLEIDDEAVGLLLGERAGFTFDASDARLQSWHGHKFSSVGEAQVILAGALKRANDR